MNHHSDDLGTGPGAGPFASLSGGPFARDPPRIQAQAVPWLFPDDRTSSPANALRTQQLGAASPAFVPVLAPAGASAPAARAQIADVVPEEEEEEEEVLTLIVDQDFMQQLMLRFGGAELSAEPSTIVRVPVSFARQIHYYALRTQLQEREEAYEAQRRRLEEDEAIARQLYQEMVESQRITNIGGIARGGGVAGVAEGPADPAPLPSAPAEARTEDRAEARRQVPHTERREALDYLAKLRLEDKFPQVDREMVHFIFASLGSEEAASEALEEQLAQNWSRPQPPVHSAAPSAAPIATPSAAPSATPSAAPNAAPSAAPRSTRARPGITEALEEQLARPRRLAEASGSATPMPTQAPGASSAAGPAGDAAEDENPWDSDSPMMSFSKYRARAETFRAERDAYFSKAKDAHHRQQKDAAGLFAQKGSFSERQYQYYSAMAAAALVAAHCERSSDSLDLHSFKANEAVIVLDLFLDHHIRRLSEGRSGEDRLTVITGKGLHSADGRPRVKPAVLERVAQRRLRFEEFRNNSGAIRIFITANSFLAHQVPGARGAQPW